MEVDAKTDSGNRYGTHLHNGQSAWPVLLPDFAPRTACQSAVTTSVKHVEPASGFPTLQSNELTVPGFYKTVRN